MNRDEETYLLARVWFEQTMGYSWEEVCKLPHIFLTNAPLTFGHSQLVVPALHGRNTANENDLFRKAAELIEKALKVLRSVLGKTNVHETSPFEKLAQDTYCYGKYIKTLILRTSADDDPVTKIKLHLVPYFQSNEADCHKRFHSLHRAPPNDKGGMLGWLGERETQIDRWAIDGFPGPVTLDQVGREVWKLPELAKHLRRAWPRSRSR